MGKLRENKIPVVRQRCRENGKTIISLKIKVDASFKGINPIFITNLPTRYAQFIFKAVLSLTPLSY